MDWIAWDTPFIKAIIRLSYGLFWEPVHGLEIFREHWLEFGGSMKISREKAGKIKNKKCKNLKSEVAIKCFIKKLNDNKKK